MENNVDINEEQNQPTQQDWFKASMTTKAHVAVRHTNRHHQDYQRTACAASITEWQKYAAIQNAEPVKPSARSRLRLN